MQINQYPNQATSLTVEDRFDVDKNLGVGVWQSQQFDIPTLIGGIQDAFPNLFDTIYTADGTVQSNRTIDQDGYKMMFVGGQFYINTTGISGGLFQSEIVGSNAMLISSTSVGIQVSGGSGTCMSLSSSNVGMFSSAPRNVVKTSGSLPSSVPSSVLEVVSTTQGSRPAPRMNTTERNAISSPADGLNIHNTDLEYPQLKHPLYGWQSIGYGRIEYVIDFSVTPFTGSPLTFETRIPSGKVLHKIVGVGSSIDASVADSIDIGLLSDTTYFSPDISVLNSDSGQSITTNSKRTLTSNEDLSITPNGSVLSGVLHITIYHT